ncbi:FAD-dependent oxidoreductase [Gammaproteobacteria bacterium]|nr:FAD-dependent oxidoreductase [Gammaproteobacteria bacterium]
MRFAIIGAGLSGITLGHLLKPYGQVVLFEKSKHVGGRLASIAPSSYSFDFGTQFFKATHDGFKSEIKPLIDQGIIQRWDGRFVEFSHQKISSQRVWDENMPHYVGTPTMNHIARSLAEGLEIHFDVTIESITEQQGWHLSDQHSKHGPFDWVISTCPGPQTAQLMPAQFAYHDVLSQIQMQSCFSLMLGFKNKLDIGFDAALVKHDDISWISVNSSKPNRPDSLCLLIHATNQWSDKNFEQDKAITQQHLIKASQPYIPIDLETADFTALHAWRYANMKKTPLKRLVDRHSKIAACGDWCLQGRVESAFISAIHTAEDIIQTLD